KYNQAQRESHNSGVPKAASLNAAETIAFQEPPVRMVPGVPVYSAAGGFGNSVLGVRDASNMSQSRSRYMHRGGAVGASPLQEAARRVEEMKTSRQFTVPAMPETSVGAETTPVE